MQNIIDADERIKC